MAFFTFMQNNSWGKFVVNERLAHVVVIEATDAEEANERAKALGLVFYEGCPTCGDRWNEADDYDADPLPMAYSDPVWCHRVSGWFRDEARIHYADGRVEAFALPLEPKDVDWRNRPPIDENLIPPEWRDAWEQVKAEKAQGGGE